MAKGNVKDYCESKFPTVEFTGGSSIHASFAKEFMIPFHSNDVRTIIKYIVDKGLSNIIVKLLLKHFHKMEYLITSEEFKALCITDVHGWLVKAGDSESPDKLTNPVTGNRFHKIAIYKDLVGGVRFWARSQDNFTLIGFRFRLEILKPVEEKQTRKTTEENCLVAVKEVEKIMQDLEIPEPYQERQKDKIRVQNGYY